MNLCCQDLLATLAGKWRLTTVLAWVSVVLPKKGPFQTRPHPFQPLCRIFLILLDLFQEAPPGFEPGMADLQSAARGPQSQRYQASYGNATGNLGPNLGPQSAN